MCEDRRKTYEDIKKGNKIKNLDGLRIKLEDYFKALRVHDSVSRPNQARLDFIYAFYPDTVPTAQSDEIGAGDIKKRISMMPKCERTIPIMCKTLFEDKTIQNHFLLYFFTLTDGQKFLRDACYEMFRNTQNELDACGYPIYHSQSALIDLYKKCQTQIEINQISTMPDDKIKGFNEILLRAIDCLTKLLWENVKGPEKEANYNNLFKNTIFKDGPAMTLARIIASFSILCPQKSIEHPIEVIKSIWGQTTVDDDSWQMQVYRGIAAFRNCEYQNAWDCFTSAKRKIRYNDKRTDKELPEYAELLSYTAHMKLINEMFRMESPSESAKADIDLACRIRDRFGNNIFCARALFERAYYNLYHADHVDIEVVFEDLDLAIKGECIDARILKADIMIKRKANTSSENTVAADLLNAVLESESATFEEKKRATDLLAKFYDETGNYELAASLGHWDAIVHERQNNFRAEKQILFQMSGLVEQGVCLFNDDKADNKSMNYVLYSSLMKEEEDWTVDHGSISDIIVNNPTILNYNRIVLSFLSRDEEKNLTDSLESIKLLNDIVAQQEKEVRQAFIDRLDIYVLNQSETASLLIDAAMGNLTSNAYFRIHICDPSMMAANELLLHHPTFIPCISKDGSKQTDKNRKIVLLGTTTTAYAILRQIIATTYLAECPTELAVIGSDAEELKRKLFENCPELTKNSFGAPFIIPKFYECKLDCLPVNYRISSTKDITEVLQQANYLVVAGENDYENLSCAVKLRTSLIKLNPDPGDRPYISVYYRNRSTAWLASQVALSSKDYTNEKGAITKHLWHESYDLHLFGSTSAFEAKHLLGNYVEGQALKLHKSYYGATYDAPNPQAEGDFYRRTYNRDSSVAAFIGIIYQCFGMGVYYRNAQEYAANRHPTIGEKYYRLLHKDNPICSEEHTEYENAQRECGQIVPNPTLLEKAASIEHSRWMGFCVSRGWTKPEEHTIALYLRQGNPQHHLEIGLLHPYIVQYNLLPREWRQLNKLIEQHSTQIKPRSDPRTPDREFVLKAPWLLGYVEPANDQGIQEHEN